MNLPKTVVLRVLAATYVAHACLAVPAVAAPISAPLQENASLTVEALSLKHDGSDLVTLTFRIVNATDQDVDFACELRADGGEGCRQVSGVYLIDGVNMKRYLVVRDSKGKCICTDSLQDVKAKSSVTLWAKYPAPPAGVKAVSVVVPRFLPLEAVPVE